MTRAGPIGSWPGNVVFSGTVDHSSQLGQVLNSRTWEPRGRNGSRRAEKGTESEHGEKHKEDFAWQERDGGRGGGTEMEKGRLRGPEGGG